MDSARGQVNLATIFIKQQTWAVFSSHPIITNQPCNGQVVHRMDLMSDLHAVLD